MEIGIEDVLTRLNNTVDIHDSTVRSFGIRYINAQGETREITGRKYTRGSKQELVGRDKRGKDFYNLQRNGVILLHDLDFNHPRSIKPAMIYGFKDYQSSSWLKVFH